MFLHQQQCPQQLRSEQQQRHDEEALQLQKDQHIEYAVDNRTVVQLNERGANLIEHQRYEEAIEVLVEAFHTASRLPASPCLEEERSCTLFDCLRFYHLAESFASEQQQEHNEEGSNVIRRPLRIPPGFARGNPHLVDLPVLSLVMTYNLALVHQLSAIRTTTTTTSYVDRNRNFLLQQAMDMYEVAYKLQLEEHRGDNRSTEFVLMILSNMADIHLVLGNQSKRKQCLEHILSTVMQLVDIANRNSDYNIDPRNKQYNPNMMNLDRYIQRIVPLLLQRNCADAA